MAENKEIRWILASASPRRKELLKSVVPDYDIIVSSCEEKYSMTSPEAIVMELAEQKGRNVLEKLSGAERMNEKNRRSDAAAQAFPEKQAYKKQIIVSADTVVSSDGLILGKPHSYDEEVEMLRALSGKKHEVYTGVFVCCADSEGNETESFLFYEATDIYVDTLTEEEITAYASTDEPYDKAGGYAIQGGFAKHISKIEGDYSNVVGFPVHAFYSLIKEQGYLE